MSELNQIYKCAICGNIVEVLGPGSGELVCCGQPMELLKEKSTEEGLEKHLPVIEKTDNLVKVKIGSIPHPMEPTHFIQWIEILADDRLYRKHLKPGDAPEAEFEIQAQDLKARELCNIHGLWKNSA